MNSQQKQEVIRKQTQKFKANGRTDNSLPFSSVPRVKSVIDEPQDNNVARMANYNKPIKHNTAVSTVKIYGFKK